MTSFKLPTGIHQKILQNLRELVFRNAQTSSQPQIMILGGQPGSGKSTLLPALVQNKIMVPINGDEFRPFHPHYGHIMRNFPAHVAAMTDPDVRVWTKSLFDEAIRHHYHIVFESTMRQQEPLCTTLKTLRAEGYQITACIMAVCDNYSRLRALQRYENSVKKTGWGRKVPSQSHDEAYRNIPLTVQRLEEEKLVDTVKIYDYQRQELYVNELFQGQWRTTPTAVQQILQERQKQAGKQ